MEAYLDTQSRRVAGRSTRFDAGRLGPEFPDNGRVLLVPEMPILYLAQHPGDLPVFLGCRSRYSGAGTV